METVVGIDASRNRSGGAKAHLIGVLVGADPTSCGIQHVHVWTHAELAARLPEFPWLTIHTPWQIERSLPVQMLWQYRCLPKEAKRENCKVIFNTDSGSVCPFQPSVTLNQDILSYEPGEIERFGFSKARLRLHLLKLIQNRTLKSSTSAVFLTQHAANQVQASTGTLNNFSVIAHGVNDEFRQSPARAHMPDDGSEIRILYVSNAAMYKHQWQVVKAVARLRNGGHNVKLRLVGGGSGYAQRRLEKEISYSDPTGTFVTQDACLPHEDIPRVLRESDVFVFASSCESFGITLLEAMASGLPIACANRSSMPETLRDGGVYFDPEDSNSIATAIERIISLPETNKQISQRAKELSEHYSWQRCSWETWQRLAEVARQSPTQNAIQRISA